ncbi:MAG: HD domain-containing phosphohydrolase [Clostridia bacterium]|jgi:putative two-component system response regulator
MEIKILIIDDAKSDLSVIHDSLSDYDLLFANDGVEAMKIIKNNPSIGIIILDLSMPTMDGFKVLQTIKKNPAYDCIAILVLTNHNETENEVKALEAGAIDYIRRPLNVLSLRRRVEVHLLLKKAQRLTENLNIIEEVEIDEKTTEIVKKRDMAINSLIGLLEIRNIESSSHTRETQWMMKMLCEHLKTKKEYDKILSDEYVGDLIKTSPIHDIGKVGIPISILLKPGKLDPSEFEIMKKHTNYRADALMIDLDTDRDNPFIRTAIEIIGTHHEKYDGTGYPKGLKGEEIPISGRLMAIIDVYAAITNKRVYRPTFSHEKALDIIRKESGKHFDPKLVDAFLEIEKDIDRIKNNLDRS